MTQLDPKTLELVVSTNVMVLGNSSAQASSMAYEAFAHSMSLLLHNEAQIQLGAKQIENAAVAAVCAKIVGG